MLMLRDGKPKVGNTRDQNKIHNWALQFWKKLKLKVN